MYQFERVDACISLMKSLMMVEKRQKLKKAPPPVLTRQLLVLFRVSTSRGKHVDGHVLRLYSEKRHITSIHILSYKQEPRISVLAGQ